MVLGFLDLQASQAQNRFYTDLEDWLSTTVREMGVVDVRAGGEAQAFPVNALINVIERLRNSIEDAADERAREVRAAPGGVPAYLQPSAAAALPIAEMTAAVERLERSARPIAALANFPVEEFSAAAERLDKAIREAGSQRATQAMVNLAESLQNLVNHMRAEQQMIRDWAEAQAAKQDDIRNLLEHIARVTTNGGRA